MAINQSVADAVAAGIQLALQQQQQQSRQSAPTDPNSKVCIA